jgi:hypothetical protein
MKTIRPPGPIAHHKPPLAGDGSVQRSSHQNPHNLIHSPAGKHNTGSQPRITHGTGKKV